MKPLPIDEARAKMETMYGENKQITDDNYDKTLAVKCINGTFVGKRTEEARCRYAYSGL